MSASTEIKRIGKGQSLSLMLLVSVTRHAKTIAEIPVFVVLPVLFTSLAYYIIDMDAAILKFLIACGVVTSVANVFTSLLT